MAEWFETMDDKLWLPNDKIGEDDAQFIQKALKLRRGMSILDAPCGAGRVTFHLARFGYDVTGIDLRAGFIRRARRRFKESGLQGTFKVLDLRKLDFESQFDAIVNWCGSFGYFDDEANSALIAAYVRALRPKGRLIIEQPDREWVLRNYKPEVILHPVKYKSVWDKQSQRSNSELIDMEHNVQRSWSSMRLYTPSQMRRLFERHKLEVEDIIRPVYLKATESFPRMVIVGKKSP